LRQREQLPRHFIAHFLQHVAKRDALQLQSAIQRAPVHSEQRRERVARTDAADQRHTQRALQLLDQVEVIGPSGDLFDTQALLRIGTVDRPRQPMGGKRIALTSAPFADLSLPAAA
jgi:hypothetical protein